MKTRELKGNWLVSETGYEYLVLDEPVNFVKGLPQEIFCGIRKIWETEFSGCWNKQDVIENVLPAADEAESEGYAPIGTYQKALERIKKCEDREIEFFEKATNSITELVCQGKIVGYQIEE